jgi:septin 7
VQIQDTPGYGDDLNLQGNIERVKSYINSQNQKWLELEASAGRGELANAVDTRVDICIFCLPPHRVRNIDMLFMWEISRVRPLATFSLSHCLLPPFHGPRGPVLRTSCVS